MSKAKRYLPIAASSSRRPLIPHAPTPSLPPLARAVRTVMWPQRAQIGGPRLSYHAALRIFAAIAAEQQLELEQKRAIDRAHELRNEAAA